MSWHPQTEKQNLGTLMAITSPSSLTCQLTVKKVQSQLQNIDDMLISMIAALLPNNLASKQTDSPLNSSYETMPACLYTSVAFSKITSAPNNAAYSNKNWL